MMDINSVRPIDGCIIFSCYCEESLKEAIANEISKLNDEEFGQVEIVAGEEIFMLRKELVEIADNEYRKIYNVERVENVELPEDFIIEELL